VCKIDEIAMCGQNEFCVLCIDGEEEAFFEFCSVANLKVVAMLVFPRESDKIDKGLDSSEIGGARACFGEEINSSSA
jgi:hypothetical protein